MRIPLPLRFKRPEEIGNPVLIHEIEELVEEFGLPEAVDFLDLLSFGQILRDACLVPLCGAPGQAFRDLLRCIRP